MKTSKSENQAIIVRAEKLRELLAEFDVRLSGFDPGVSGYSCPQIGDSRPMGSYIQFEAFEWKWLEPLLEELRAHRTQAGQSRFKGMTKFDLEIRRADREKKRLERERKLEWHRLKTELGRSVKKKARS